MHDTLFSSNCLDNQSSLNIGTDVENTDMLNIDFYSSLLSSTEMTLISETTTNNLPVDCQNQSEYGQRSYEDVVNSNYSPICNYFTVEGCNDNNNTLFDGYNAFSHTTTSTEVNTAYTVLDIEADYNRGNLYIQ